MKVSCITLAIGLGFVATAHAETISGVPAPGSDGERIAFLLAQNERNRADIARLEAELSAKPKSREEVFAMCMQATLGQTSAMAAESIGSHCDLLLK